MSIVIQIGQCGNQLGEAVFNKLFKEITENPSLDTEKHQQQFFHRLPTMERPVANAITIDMEPKVIERLMESNKKSKYYYSNFNMYHKQEGSGNNWAYGYYKHGPKCEDDIYKKVRQLGERIDNFSSVCFIQSLAGGTGSGLGSSILYRLKDEFPNIFFNNYLVVPKQGGEVILQNYNSVFSLSSIYQNADSVFLLQNDQAHQICKEIYGMKNIGMDPINDVLSTNITASLLVNNPGYDMECSSYKDVFQRELIPVQHAKLLGCRFVPLVKKEHKAFQNDNWKSISNRAMQVLLNGGSEAKVNWGMKPTSPNANRSLALYLDFNSQKEPIDVAEFEKNDFAFNNLGIYHKKKKKPVFKGVSSELKR